jgi:RNA polymerase sigma-70 factor (ECF subfamily)
VDVPSDVELVRNAQAGEVAALGLLLVRHRADMRVVALSILGYGPDSEDLGCSAPAVGPERGLLVEPVRDAAPRPVRNREAPVTGPRLAFLP